MTNAERAKHNQEIKKSAALVKKIAALTKKHCEMVTKHCEMLNQKLAQMDEINKQSIKKIEAQKISDLSVIAPIEENFVATAIRCNYCKNQQGCPISAFDLNIRQICCPLHELPVDYSRVEGKLPTERLSEFISFSN